MGEGREEERKDRRKRTNRLLLNSLDLQRLQLLIEDLTQIHHHRLVDLLPQMSAEDLNEGDLERRDLTVHCEEKQR
jgi:hypothetical protein